MIKKVRDWGLRYLPAEMSGTVLALFGAWFAYFLTGNRVVAAFCGAWFDTLGYYSVIVFRDVRASKRMCRKKGVSYDKGFLFKDVKNLVVEFGFSESIDSFIVRPFCMYVFPLLIGNLVVGVVIGKLVADLVFYVPTIFFYERRKKKDKN